MIQWQKLDSEAKLAEIQTLSTHQKVFIFKHSTRCNISATALHRLERAWKTEEMVNCLPYLLDLLQYRNLSNLIAQTYQVPHESPQILVIDKGKCIYHKSHYDIDYKALQTIVSN